METPAGSAPLRQRLQTALVAAMRSRDVTAVAALRSALGAIANAEAVDAGGVVPIGPAPIARAATGLGAGDVARQELTEMNVIAIVQTEISERETAASSYDRLGRGQDADRIRAEANVLREHLG